MSSTTPASPLIRLPASRVRTILLIVACLLGLAIRLYDLTDPPLDFHPTRQLLSALKARGMYYQSAADVPEWQREFAISQWKGKAEIEPELVERLAALTYRFTGEQLWIGRAYSSIFWIVGGAFLYLLMRELVSEHGAWLGTLLYLFLPYAVLASRSFQPDPLMVMLVIIFWWAVVRWGRYPSSWAWAAFAGLAGGLAIFVKFSAAFFVIGGGLGAVLGAETLARAVRRPQLWVLVGAGVLPGAAYLAYGVFIGGFLGRQFGGRFIPSLLISPVFYFNWLTTLNYVLGGALLTLALLGLLLLKERRAQVFTLSLWAAYALYGLFFDYHIWSHDYYNLPLIPIAAISLASISDWFGTRLGQAVRGSRLRLSAAAAILTFGVLAAVLDARGALKAVDYRPQAARWAEIGEVLGREARVVALTRDYGSSLAYWGWLAVADWPTSGDLQYHAERGAQTRLEETFARLTRNRDYFLVTDFEELERQVWLLERLESLPVSVRTEDYLIYDLRAPPAQ